MQAEQIEDEIFDGFLDLEKENDTEEFLFRSSSYFKPILFLKKTRIDTETKSIKYLHFFL